MNIKKTKYELQHILQGKSGASHDAFIQAITLYLGGSKSAGPMAEAKHDENVLTKDNVLYFIDTVFYLNQDVFWI